MTYSAILIGWAIAMIAFLFFFHRFVTMLNDSETEVMKDDIIDLRMSASDLRVQAGRAFDAATRERLLQRADALDRRAEAMTRKVFG